MGYDISWSLHRPLRLDERERRALIAHVCEQREMIVGYDLALPGDDVTETGDLIAWGSLRPSHGDPARADHGGHLPDVVERVLDALAVLRALVPDVELAVSDDFTTYAWRDDGWEPDGDGRAAAAPTSETGWVHARGHAPAPTSASASASASGPAVPAARSDLAARIDALVDVYLGRKLTPATRAAAALPRAIMKLRDRELREAVGAALAALPNQDVGDRLVARLRELYGTAYLDSLCGAVWPSYVADADQAAQVTARWDEAIDDGWESAVYLPGVFAGALGSAALFARALETVAAPDAGRARRRMEATFELLRRADDDRRGEVVCALLARIHADRGRAIDAVPWRALAYEGLRRFAGPLAAPTATLELADPVTARAAAPLLEVVARDRARGAAVIARAVELPGLATHAVAALVRERRDDVATWLDYLAHPFWMIRAAAAEHAPFSSVGPQAMGAVWRSIEAWEHPVPDAAVAAARTRANLRRDTPWTEYARAPGGELALPPLPPLRDGLAASCADQRAWTIAAVDDRGRAEDAAALVAADELDLALARRGFPRTAPRWSRWCRRLPALPTDPAGRRAWARAHQDDLAPILRQVLCDGGAAVAATFGPPHLDLSPDARAALESDARPPIERGAALLWPP